MWSEPSGGLYNTPSLVYKEHHEIGPSLSTRLRGWGGWPTGNLKKLSHSQACAWQLLSYFPFPPCIRVDIWSIAYMVHFSGQNISRVQDMTKMMLLSYFACLQNIFSGFSKSPRQMPSSFVLNTGKRQTMKWGSLTASNPVALQLFLFNGKRLQ